MEALRKNWRESLLLWGWGLLPPKLLKSIQDGHGPELFLLLLTFLATFFTAGILLWGFSEEARW